MFEIIYSIHFNSSIHYRMLFVVVAGVDDVVVCGFPDSFPLIILNSKKNSPPFGLILS